MLDLMPEGSLGSGEVPEVGVLWWMEEVVTRRVAVCVLHGHFGLQGPILHLSSRKSTWVIWEAQTFCLSALG